MYTTRKFLPSDPGAADTCKGLYWNSLPFGEFLWIRMGIHLRIYKDSPNSTTRDPPFGKSTDKGVPEIPRFGDFQELHPDSKY